MNWFLVPLAVPLGAVLTTQGANGARLPDRDHGHNLGDLPTANVNFIRKSGRGDQL
jgi:hypothetical protein